MTRLQLQAILDQLESQEVWAFSLNMVKFFCQNESEHTIAVSLSRHVKSGIIKQVCRGVYANPRSGCIPDYSTEALAWIIRSGEQFYLSLETVLSESGYLSQMPNRLTFMTTGRSQIFNTPFGILEFIHSKADRKSFLKGCEYDEKRGIWVASVAKAAVDAKKTKRSIDLIDWEDLAA